jgi:5-methylcytosine-specific restriction endonuclease McrA
MTHGPARRAERFGQRGDYPLPALKRGQDGRYLCRWCEGPVPKGKRYWCSNACVLEYRMRADWGFIRDQIIERDRVCRADTGFTARQGYALRAAGIEVWGSFNVVEVRWEVDHILPVIEGGTDDPSNLRLLCIRCHHEHTARWRRARAAGPQLGLLG